MPDSELTRRDAGLNARSRDEFHHRGLIKLDGLIPEEVILPVRARLHRLLERADVCSGGRWTAGKVRSPEDYRTLHSELLKRLKASIEESISAFNTRAIHRAAEYFAQDKLQNLIERPQLLFTPPNAEHWRIPNRIWHVDVPRLGSVQCPGIQMFTFIDTLPPGAGGTVVVAGSHHYVNDQGRVRSKQVKKELMRTHPWFRGLFDRNGADRSRYMDAATLDGDIELQVVELTGQPGDVFLMDLRLIHSLAPNAGDRPRLMVTQRYYSTRHGLDWYSG